MPKGEDDITVQKMEHKERDPKNPHKLYVTLPVAAGCKPSVGIYGTADLGLLKALRKASHHHLPRTRTADF